MKIFLITGISLTGLADIIFGFLLFESSNNIILLLLEDSECFKCHLTGFDFGFFMKISVCLYLLLSVFAIISGIGLIKHKYAAKIIHLTVICPLQLFFYISLFEQWYRWYMFFILFSVLYSSFFLIRSKAEEVFD